MDEFEKLKTIIDDEYETIMCAERFHYKTATVFCNVPLALIQTAMESKVILLRKLKAVYEKKEENIEVING